MKTLIERKKEAKERDAVYQKLSGKQRLLKLDLKLGGGVGAVKERAKIALFIEKENNKSIAEPQSVADPKPKFKKGSKNAEYRKKERTLVNRTKH